MCSSSPPPAPAAPDYSGIAAANEASAKYAKEAADADLAFRKQQYADNQPYTLAMQQLAQRIGRQQADISDFNDQAARQQWLQQQQQFRPTEAQTVMDAMGSQYMGDADRAAMAGILTGNFQGTEQQKMLEYDRLARAASDGAALQAQQQTQAMANSAFAQQARNLQRMGGDPTKLAAYAAELANNQTLNNITANNQAREAQYQRGVGLRTGVANFGRNMPNTAGQAFGLASQAGSAGVNNMNTAAQGWLPGAQFAAGGYGSQMQAGQIGSQAALGMGGLMNQSYGTQMQGWAAQQNAAAQGAAGLGSFLGGAMAFGSKFIKPF